MFFAEKEIINRIKNEYPKGTKVELVSMNDPYTTIPIGTKGVVDCVDDVGTIHVNWENGSSLGIIYGEDVCRKL